MTIVSSQVRGSSDFVDMPWANGQGVTTELAVEAAGEGQVAAPFLWRISRAAVSEDGPFSAFEAIDRVLTVLPMEGEQGTTPPHRLSITVEGVAKDVYPLEPFSFSGSAKTSATLLGGQVTDLNLMTSREGCDNVDVECVAPQGEGETGWTIFRPPCTVLLHAGPRPLTPSYYRLSWNIPL